MKTEDDKQIWQIGGMDCADCAREVESGVRKLEGVESVEVSFATGKMTLEGDVPFDILQRRVEALGKTIITENESDTESEQRGGVIGFWEYLNSRNETRLALFGGGLVLLTFILSTLGILPETPASVFYIAGMAITLYPIARSGLQNLLINHTFNINLLMTIAAIGAMAIGEFLEGATVIFLFAIGESLEGYTVERARASIRGLMTLKPKHALKIHGDHEHTVGVDELKIGDHILVRPFDHIPMDGIIVAGASGVNQAPITGESVPVHKERDDEVFAGSINGESALEIQITKLAEDNTINRIIQMVEDAQSTRAPSQRMVDRFAQYYTPAVVILAAGVALLPPLLFGLPFLDTASERGWLYRALVMLVIACPCALVVSTPVTVISAITRAIRQGVLMKGGVFLEELGKIRAVIFDKTGTLTEGKPEVVSWRSFACETGEICADCNDVLAMASAVEQYTPHPLAVAVVESATAQGVSGNYAPAENVTMLAGQGVQGVVGEHMVTIGNHRLFDAEFPHTQDECLMVEMAEAGGSTTMMLSDGEIVRGFIEVMDTPRDSSKEVVRELNEMGIETVMCTGDNATVAKAIAEDIGIQEVRAELMPEDKVRIVRETVERLEHVAMVGDGINDTPALSAASVGIAMGGAGNEQTMETADVVLMADDLKQLPGIIRLSRFARRIILQNITLSIAMKLIVLTLAVGGFASLWAAILVDVGMLMVVTLNGMRPMRFRD